MKRVATTILGATAALCALLCFAAAVVLSRTAAVPVAPVPEARDVRAAVEFARMGETLVQAPRPIAFRLPQRWLEGVHRLVSHAKPNLGVDASIDARGATFRLSKRLMRNGWLNLAVRLDQSADGKAPSLSLVVGGWHVPDALTASLLRVGLPLLRADGQRLTRLSDIVPQFRVDGDGLQLTAMLPKNLIGGLQAVLSPGPGTMVDMSLARSFYGDLLGYVLLHPDSDYPHIIRHVTEHVRSQDDLKAAVVALTMFVDGPRVRRLGGERTSTPPCPLQAQTVFIHGRDDLPKHWTISAALALFLNQRTARAIGLWKELDDSLLGGDGLATGSGFSFVDLGADTAGIAVGMAARDGKGFDAVLAGLRSGKADTILPPGTLRLPEGVPLAQFQQQYGPLEQPRMLQAEQRIHAILRQSPLYRLSFPDTP